ncbi:MAG TPA: site-specific integrase, partial [Acidimicrobiales bacterium]|nr:site-specific integrase [Acidimicrobiales bacterium]
MSASNRFGLCYRCLGRWRRSEAVSLQEFCSSPAPLAEKAVHRLCLVCRTPGHERPVHFVGLCGACVSTMGQRGQSLAEYLRGDERFPPAAPRASFGRCLLACCKRWAAHRAPALCVSHYARWRDQGRPGGEPFASWCARQRDYDLDRGVVALGAISERARLEILYGLQCRARCERRTSPKVVQMVANLLQERAVSSVFELSVEQIEDERRLFVDFVRDQVRLALARPETEMERDDWDLRVFGRRGKGLHFGQISQPWLKQGAKAWAAERLVSVRATGHIERVVQDLGAFSQSLRRNRLDSGTEPAALARGDVLAFSNDLAQLEGAGRLSAGGRRTRLNGVAQFLREARALGLARSGQPLAGLGEDVVLGPFDRPRGLRRDPDEEGRALPQVVADQLLAPEALDALEAGHGSDVRAAVELEAEVGRRTGELCRLSCECLVFDEVSDEHGQVQAAPVLIHDMPKVAVRGYRLPISEEAAIVIAAQQARVRARYPHTPSSSLALFPAPEKNPRGTKAMSVDYLCIHVRAWVDGLPELLGPGGEPYDRSGTTFYSWRHTYAQRHADSGTPVEVLAVLMGHTQLTTTQIYYRVTAKRKRRAVDLLASLQLDRDGVRSRPVVERLLDVEHVRDAVGQVAVPFGICAEPTNVKAHGQACPFRYQCFGCTHFHTDPSFLPELEGHLARLLADRERLRAAASELEEWARMQAIPSAEEAGAVRRVIDRCRAVLDELPEAERAAVDEAIAVLRRGRAQLDVTVPVRFLGLVTQ